jgi:hypothetical protein
VNRAAASVPSRAAAWRFTSANGVALTAVNVGDEPCNVTFPNAPGRWRDAITEAEFGGQGGTLTVPVPAHAIRLLSSSPLHPVPVRPPKF